MRCIFCKSPSHTSRSSEHIVPESLGNKTRTLRPGIVCDRCNNYFARKIEAPLLAHDSFRNLRARWQIPTKQGKYPRWRGSIAGTDIDVGLRLSRTGEPEVTLERERDHKRLLEVMTPAVTGSLPPPLVFSEAFEPPQRELSRLLAKMALEAVAQRHLLDSASKLEIILESGYFDPIRNWARRGTGTNHWPYAYRRIAPEETYMLHPTAKNWVRAGFSYDVFLTKRTETYFALCLYGYEWVINVGGPSTKGYDEWLEDNGQISPVVERLGLRLTRREGACGPGLYWEGEGDLTNGVSFDRRQLDNAAAEGLLTSRA